MSKKTKNQWNSIDGTMQVWGKKWGKGKDSYFTYSTSLGRKLDNGDYDNLFVSVKFVKDAEEPKAEGSFTVEVEKGFLTFEKYTSKDGIEVIKYVVVITDGTFEEN